MKTSGSICIFQGILVLLVTYVLAFPVNAAKKPRYEWTEIVQTLAGSYANPTAINNHGVVVGGGFGEPDDGQPFLYRNGKMELLPVISGSALDINDAGDVLVHGGFEGRYGGFLIRAGTPILLQTESGQSFFPAALNNRGQVVGQGGTFQVATWSNGVVRPLGVPTPGWISIATDINDSGVAVGGVYQYEDGPGEFNHRAVMYRDDQTIPLGTLPGFAFSYAHAINNRGDIIGIAWNDENIARGFLYRAGSFADLGTLPGATKVRPKAINNLGHVIGNVENAENHERPFLYMDGVMRDLTRFIKPTTNFAALIPNAINDKGQIVAIAYFNAADPHALLLTPRYRFDPDALQELIQLVRMADISPNQKMPLLAWLKAAEHAFERERIEHGIRRLEGFQRKVEQPCHERRYVPGRLAMMRKSCIPPALQQQLIDAAQAIIDSLEEHQEPNVFDLADDFSLSSNPAGAWTYGYQVSLSSSFIPFTFWKYNYDDYGTPVEVWAINSYEVPAIQRNATDKTVYSDGGAGTYPPGTTWFYPGPGAWEGSPSYSEAIRLQANYGVVRFTLPAGAAGNYRLATDVKSAYTGGISGDTDFHIFKNGVEMFGEFLPELGAASFEDVVALAPGDTIDFVIGRGLDDSYHGSGLVIEARLTQLR